jgi:hypothetical protein
MKKYLITVVFNDGGSHSREIEAKNKKDAENDFWADMPSTVRDHVKNTVIQIQKK